MDRQVYDSIESKTRGECSKGVLRTYPTVSLQIRTPDKRLKLNELKKVCLKIIFAYLPIKCCSIPE